MADWSERDVVIEVGGAKLHGTLTVPSCEGRSCGALIIAGSGPVDRNGNLPGAENNALLLLAHALAALGITTLRVDKRGIGASSAAGPSEEHLRFSTYVDDACAWLRFLGAQAQVDHCALIGHSEGALVATLAAKQVEVAALILIAGAGRKAGDVIRDQLAAASISDVLRAEALRTLAALQRQELVPAVSPELAALFRPSVQPYLMTWLDIDPAAQLATLATPTLTVHGTADLQIGEADHVRLSNARPGVEAIEIPDMNHVLKLVPWARQANLAAYTEHDLPVATALVDAIVAFLQRSNQTGSG